MPHATSFHQRHLLVPASKFIENLSVFDCFRCYHPCPPWIIVFIWIITQITTQSDVSKGQLIPLANPSRFPVSLEIGAHVSAKAIKLLHNCAPLNSVTSSMTLILAQSAPAIPAFLFLPEQSCPIDLTMMTDMFHIYTVQYGGYWSKS